MASTHMIDASGNPVKSKRSRESVMDLPMIAEGAIDGLPRGVEARLDEMTSEIVLWMPKRNRHVVIPVAGFSDYVAGAVALLCQSLAEAG